MIGREFRLDVLQQLTGLGEDDLYAALEEAQGAVVIEERSSVGAVVTYPFSHGFFRQTLYEEMIAPRRMRLHQQVAHALEEVHAARLEEHAAELAEHFSHSSDPADLAKAIEYGEMASQRATSVYAFGESVRLLEHAVQVQEVLDPEDKAKRCDLLLNLGEALLNSAEPRRILGVVAPEAFAICEGRGDGLSASKVCRLARSALLLQSRGPGSATPEAALWAERANRYAAPGTIERVWADLSLGTLRETSNTTHIRPEQAALLRDALDLARQLVDEDTLWQAAQANLYLLDPQHVDERLRLAEEFAERPRAGVRSRTLETVLPNVADAFLVWCQRERMERAVEEYRVLAQDHRPASGSHHHVAVGCRTGHPGWPPARCCPVRPPDKGPGR